MSARSATLLLFVAFGLGGCALHTGHTIQPYGRDAVEARKLEDRAIAACRTHQGGQLPPYSFTTDGCSYFPDSTWKECCVTHDMAYWCGGTLSDRMDADRELKDCVYKETGSCVLANGMRTGVFLGGAQLWPTSFRWGYGWPYPWANP